MKQQIYEIVSQKYSLEESTVKKIEHFLECLNQESMYSFFEVEQWIENSISELQATVKEVPLSSVTKSDSGWYNDSETGNLKHKSGGFFEVIGVDVDTSMRESGSGWKQPMVDQGTESSVAGIIKKKFNGIAHYLLQAKFEPGNYGDIQISPTLQVTYSNLNKAHGGRRPRFTEYFDNSKNVSVLYEQWLPEDGGRFYNKRVKYMLVELDEKQDIDFPSSFMWLTMNQIKKLMFRDNIVNPHVRSIISHL